MSVEAAMTVPDPLPSSALFYREGASDKVYQAWIEAKDSGYTVNFAYGRRGSALQTGTKTQAPIGYEAAAKIYEKIVGEKKSKGYTPDVSGQAFAMTEKAGLVSGRLPQLLNLLSETDVTGYLDSDEWLMEEKHDGRRLMVEVKNGMVEGSNRKGLVVSLPREVETALLPVGDCVLDGELVGTQFWIFDVLSVAGEDVSRLSLTERVSKRDALPLLDSMYARTVTTYRTAAEKAAAYAEIRDAKKEGVVFKRATAGYKVGRPSAGGDQVKVKFYATCSALVAKVNNQRSVALTLDGTGVGNVTIPINFELPRVGDVVEARYLYANRGGALYQATYLGVRDDIEPGECTLSQIKYKADTSEDDSDAA